MKKTFTQSFSKKGKDLYNITLDAISNLDFKHKSEDDNDLIIEAKTPMTMSTFGLNLNISIKGSKLTLIASSFQYYDPDSKGISEKLFNEIKILSVKSKKAQSLKREKIEKNINEPEKRWIKFKDGMTEPIHCDQCNKKTKHYVTAPFHPLVTGLLFCIVIGLIIVMLADTRFTCNKCENSYINWG